MYAERENASNEYSTQQDVKKFIPRKVLAGQSFGGNMVKCGGIYIYEKKRNA